ncbi:hypothetical protein ACE1OA_33070 [Streptomyces sp. JL2001]|uniref:hypothetical protein n=1 Tax=unclassified Streptomyces TaxID=2593676 RepID=UPI00368AB75F
MNDGPEWPPPSSSAYRVPRPTAGGTAGVPRPRGVATLSPPRPSSVADVRKAVAACAGGYGGGGALHFTKVTALKPFAVGEETVAYRLEGRGPQPTACTLVREGSVLIVFVSATTTGAAPVVPQPLLVQQFMKVQAANSRR